MRCSNKLLALVVTVAAGIGAQPASALPPDIAVVYRGNIYTALGDAAVGSSSTKIDRIDVATRAKVEIAEIVGRDVVHFSAGFGRIFITTEVTDDFVNPTRIETEVTSFNLAGGDERVETSAVFVRTAAGSCGTRITQARPVSASTFKILRQAAGNPPVYPDSCASPTKTHNWSISNVDRKTFPIPFGGIGFEGSVKPIAWFGSKNVSRYVASSRGTFDAGEEVTRGETTTGGGGNELVDRKWSLHAAAIARNGDMALIWQDRTKTHRHRKLVLYPRFGSLRGGTTLSAPANNPTSVEYCGTKLVEIRGRHRSIVLRGADGKPIRTLWRSPKGGVASRFACDGKRAVFYTWSTIKSSGSTLRIRNIR